MHVKHKIFLNKGLVYDFRKVPSSFGTLSLETLTYAVMGKSYEQNVKIGMYLLVINKVD